MSLHGLTSITLGVPDVDAVASYYEDFGLRRVGDRPGRGLVFATAEGGEQLVLRPAERRRRRTGAEVMRRALSAGHPPAS